MRHLLILAVLSVSASASAQTNAPTPEQRELITASFTSDQILQPNQTIELVLKSALKDPDERIAVMIVATDVSSLFTRDGLRLRYNAALWALPVGESLMTVYLVTQRDDWKEMARFRLRVAKEEDSRSQAEAVLDRAESDSRSNFVKARLSGPFVSTVDRETTTADEGANSQQTASTPQPSARKPRKMKFTPSLTLTIPSQPAQSTFPGPQPQRATFIQLDMQASLKNEASYGLFNAQSSVDFAGSSFEQQALRFGTDGSNAPKVDLSSYLIHFETGRVKYDVGHFSYGTQRQLINGFSSRGLQISVPFLKRFDFTAATMNGTQLVGYRNFFGIDKSKHRMVSGTLGIEFKRKRPGGLRLEVSALNAYFQPISGVNRGVITDLQRSNGVAVRLLANDKGGRFHFEGGFTRSFFASPNDQTLSQGATLVVLPNLTRNAHYLEASYQILKDHSLTKTKKVNLSVAFQEENVAPLFRSLGASTQADKIQYNFSVNGSINEITAQFAHTNFHDNLRRIPSILRSLTGNTHIGLGAPMSALLNQTKPSLWLPRLGYSFDRVHAFGDAIPVNGGFEVDPSSVPDLVGTNQTFSADWQIKKFTWGYNLNHSFQDNRARGRERADQGVLVNTARVGIAASSKLNFNLDFSAESSANKETGRIDRTYRVGPGVTWQLTKHMGLSANLSNTIAGDAAKTSHSRNTEFDASWTYRFEQGKESPKKVSGQFFIRYANHYSRSLERIFLSDTLSKNQTLTANIGITFF